MKLAIKMPLSMDSKSAGILEGQSRILNWRHNHLLETANEQKEIYKKTGSIKAAQIIYSDYGLRNLVPALKKAHPFLRTSHSAPLKNSALRLTRSIKAFQSYQKKKKLGGAIRKVGWPKFRSSKKKFYSIQILV